MSMYECTFPRQSFCLHELSLRSCPLIHTYRLGEDLQQDTLVVSVGEEAELLQLAELVLGQRVLADASCESGEGGRGGVV